MSKPLLIDLYCGLGGWAEGFLAEGWDVVGFDIERHDYGQGGYPGRLILQDAKTIHGSQLKAARGIVASPPCTEYSYMAMPWSRGKQIGAALRGEGVGFPDKYEGSRSIHALNELFHTCQRLQAEASHAAGRRIPMVIENVKGAQPWVGAAQARFGSYYLWGDVWQNGNLLFVRTPQFGGGLKCPRRVKVGRTLYQHRRDGFTHTTHLTSRAAGVKQRGSGAEWFDRGIANMSSSSPARKAETARIAKVPLELAQFIAREWKGTRE